MVNGGKNSAMPWEQILLGVAATAVLWAFSATLAMLMALVVAAGLLSTNPVLRACARCCSLIFRGIPTSILVLFAGIASLQLGEILRIPVLFPGTASEFQHVAFAVVVALGFGSAGHLAAIFQASYQSLGRCRKEYIALLGLPLGLRLTLTVRECAEIALPPVGARLVHHLHNTAFASLFPVFDLFGVLQGNAYGSARVFYFTVGGACLYVVLSQIIWSSCRWLEAIASVPVLAARTHQ